MDLTDLLPHVLGFAAPAAFLALLLPALTRLVLRPTGGLPWWVQVLALFIAGLTVLGAGLWSLGRDGKMLTYGALVAAAATTQWLVARAWR